MIPFVIHVSLLTLHYTSYTIHCQVPFKIGILSLSLVLCHKIIGTICSRIYYIIAVEFYNLQLLVVFPHDAIDYKYKCDKLRQLLHAHNTRVTLS